MRKKKIRLSTLQKTCIKKFFFDEYKHIIQANYNTKNGQKMQSLGLETSYDMCIALFEDGSLGIKAFNEKEFFVFLYHKKQRKYELIYDSKKILI